MKAVILAGGLGTRISEESNLRPKPMIEIGGKPIIWHIMKMYAAHGVTDFIICAGYKGYMIKEYFYNYFLHQTDIEVRLKDNSCTFINNQAEDWTVKVIDTGATTQTGGRLKRVRQYLDTNEAFCFTYGDGVSSVDISKTINFHKQHGKDATITAVYPPGRFGALDIEGNMVAQFKEKPKGDGAFINGGFFVLSPKVLERINGDNCIWEQKPLMGLAKDGELMAFRHEGFWQPMDTLRDKNSLQKLWESGEVPWQTSNWDIPL